ncbi:MAG TPA: hypothetical protein P5016_03635, partial [Verrucomicrobiales bacterium]|nr:hypothetical protein [Verrucomicrobiales bacterium]
MSRRIFQSLVVILTALPVIGLRAATPVFEKDIRPILKAQCFQCHGEAGETKGGLDVRLRRFIAKGGESGTAIVPGAPAKSHLLELVKAGKMPKGKARLSDAQI